MGQSPEYLKRKEKRKQERMKLIREQRRKEKLAQEIHESEEIARRAYTPAKTAEVVDIDEYLKSNRSIRALPPLPDEILGPDV